MRDKYVEDSTRGSAKIDPLNYKDDVLVQVWIDSRVLATLSQYLDLQGEYPRYMSEVVRRPLQALCEALVNQGDVELIDDTAIARDMLSRKYRVNLNKGGRGGRNVIHNQILSEIQVCP